MLLIPEQGSIRFTLFGQGNCLVCMNFIWPGPPSPLPPRCFFVFTPHPTFPLNLIFSAQALHWRTGPQSRHRKFPEPFTDLGPASNLWAFSLPQWSRGVGRKPCLRSRISPAAAGGPGGNCRDFRPASHRALTTRVLGAALKVGLMGLVGQGSSGQILSLSRLNRAKSQARADKEVELERKSH